MGLGGTGDSKQFRLQALGTGSVMWDSSDWHEDAAEVENGGMPGGTEHLPQGQVRSPFV